MTMKLTPKSSDDLSESGFRAQLRQAYLPDLVQLECLSRSRRVIRVTTVHAVGYLFFADGQVIHASIGDLEGEEAAREILSWSQGTFEPCERPWAPRATITKSWQALLLHAVQAQDERGHGRTSTHSGHPQPGGREATAEQGKSVPLKSAALGKIPSTALRLDVRGAITSNHGASEEFAALVSYAFRQVEMIGELLGAESFKALECAAGEQRTFISREGNGDLVAVQSADAQTIAQVRERLGLSS
jgi:hypothetical protein